MGVTTCKSWDDPPSIQMEMVAPFQDTNSTLETNFRRDIHGATAAYYARHAGITGEFLMRHEGKKRKAPVFFHWVLLAVVLGLLTVSNPLKLWLARKHMKSRGFQKGFLSFWGWCNRGGVVLLRECREWAFHVIFWATRNGLCLVMNKSNGTIFLTKWRAHGQLFGGWTLARKFSELSCCIDFLCNTSFNWDLKKAPGRLYELSPNGRIFFESWPHGSWAARKLPSQALNLVGVARNYWCQNNGTPKSSILMGFSITV